MNPLGELPVLDVSSLHGVRRLRGRVPDGLPRDEQPAPVAAAPARLRFVFRVRTGVPSTRTRSNFAHLQRGIHFGSPDNSLRKCGSPNRQTNISTK